MTQFSEFYKRVCKPTGHNLDDLVRRQHLGNDVRYFTGHQSPADPNQDMLSHWANQIISNQLVRHRAPAAQSRSKWARRLELFIVASQVLNED